MPVIESCPVYVVYVRSTPDELEHIDSVWTEEERAFERKYQLEAKLDKEGEGRETSVWSGWLNQCLGSPVIWSQ